jgi:hypothetical protein
MAAANKWVLSTAFRPGVKPEFALKNGSFPLAGAISALPVTHPRRLFVPKNVLKTAFSRH